MATDLIVRAQAGDEQAFGQLVEPYQRELQVHCYRILGSAQDAEDVLAGDPPGRLNRQMGRRTRSPRMAAKPADTAASKTPPSPVPGSTRG